MRKVGKSPKLDTGLSLPFDMFVYQATSKIFVGAKAKVRKLKFVERYITEHSGDKSLVVKLVAQYGTATVHPSILRLLSNGVYESKSKARQCFPDLFQPPSAQGGVGTVVKEEAATTTEHIALVDIGQTQANESQENSDSTEATMVLSDINDGTVENHVVSSPVLPVYLPFPAEHMLMEELQKALELACYQFGLSALPSIMQEQGWDCPQSVELSEWVKLVGRKKDIVWGGGGEPTESLLQSIAAIRHAAVHRLRTNSTGLEQFLADAERLAVVLGNNTFTETISQLRLDIHATLVELIQKKQSTQLQLEKAQEEIARQRAELDQKEEEALRGMASQDRKYSELAGERLKRVVHLMGDLRGTSVDQGAVLESVDAIEHQPLPADISDFDDDERFEDCSEA
ncbi:hypothetical protein NW768_011831 [Fusarium equiseti]|uniref:Uncharacterized protein n=1 Tax=Fusarium equiseti TaxID=61235 RepID=A0ABQ8QWG2_FUSEQ|nr:hypothetical protein NW768_011831 [Fusarium equiseti]